MANIETNVYSATCSAHEHLGDLELQQAVADQWIRNLEVGMDIIWEHVDLAVAQGSGNNMHKEVAPTTTVQGKTGYNISMVEAYLSIGGTGLAWLKS